MLPHQRKMFKTMADTEQELDLDINDLFEREANNFAVETLFQLDKYEKLAADYEISIKTPMDLATKFGSSIYASMRRYVHTHFASLGLAVYDEIAQTEQISYQLRRAPMYSKSFIRKFGCYDFPIKTSIEDDLGRILNKSRFQMHNKIAVKNLRNEYYLSDLQIFNNTYQIFVLIIPQKKISQKHVETLAPVLLA